MSLKSVSDNAFFSLFTESSCEEMEAEENGLEEEADNEMDRVLWILLNVSGSGNGSFE